MPDLIGHPPFHLERPPSVILSAAKDLFLSQPAVDEEIGDNLTL